MDILPDIPPLALLFAIVVTFFAATVQSSIGLGFAMISVPVLSLADDALAPVPQLLVTLPLTLSILWRERAAMDFKSVRWVLVGRFPGAALGVGMLLLFSTNALNLFIGLVVLVFVFILNRYDGVRRTSLTEFSAGLFSGVTAVVSSIGGPPVALLYRNDVGPYVRANLSLIFSFGVLVTILSRAIAGKIAGQDLAVAVYLLPGLLAGVWFGGGIKGRLEESFGVKKAILSLSAAAAGALVARAGYAIWIGG